MGGVYRKEIGHYFRSMTGYVYIAMFLAVSGALFMTGNLLSQNGDIRSFFSSATSAVVLLLPILTMGVFAEERRQKTDELLLSSPLRFSSLVLGKFLSTFTVFLVPLAATGAYPLLLLRFGASSPMVTLGCYLGFALLGMSLIAIGMFLSLLTDSQFMAAVLTWALFALLLMLDSAAGYSGSAFLSALLRFAALTGHYRGFSYGVFHLSEAVYYLSVTALFLFLCVHALERRRLS